MITQTTSYPHWTQVYGEGAGKDEYPRVYRSDFYIRVYHKKDVIADRFFVGGSICNGTLRGATIPMKEEEAGDLLTGPEAAEYVAAAREGRDAVWPKKDADPWPHWFTNERRSELWRADSTASVFVCDRYNPEWRACFNCAYENLTGKFPAIKIPAPEAAALLAKWEAERNPPPALPGAEEVAAAYQKQFMSKKQKAFNDALVACIAEAIEEDRQRGRRGE